MTKYKNVAVYAAQIIVDLLFYFAIYSSLNIVLKGVLPSFEKVLFIFFVLRVLLIYSVQDVSNEYIGAQHELADKCVALFMASIWVLLAYISFT